RRAQDLQVVLPALHTGEPVHMLLDSTGLKVFGEGEWKGRKHS
ncbi:transposase, partial [Ralstonia solanacearum]